MKTKLIRRTLVREFDDSFFFFNTFTNVTFEAKRVDNISLQEYIDQNQDMLVDDGVLCVSDEAYYELMDFFYHRDVNNTKSVAITDALSFNCNLRCVYCMQQNTPNVTVKFSPEDRIQLWKGILEILNAEELSVCLFGGEPFYDKNYVRDLLEIAKNSDINLQTVFAVTNGVLLDETGIGLINDFGISSLQITIDGPKDIHDLRRVKVDGSGSYDLIIENIGRILKETEAEIYINTVLDKNNYDSYLKMVDYLISIFSDDILNDNPRIIFNLGNECDPYQGCVYTESSKIDDSRICDYYDLLELLMKKGVVVSGIVPAPSCLRNNHSELILGPDGSLYNCISGIGLEEFRICDSKELLERPVYALNRLVLARKSIKNTNCRTCGYYGMCNGGCYYDMVVNNRQTSCQKALFNQSIDKMMDIFRNSVEIKPDLYRCKDFVLE